MSAARHRDPAAEYMRGTFDERARVSKFLRDWAQRTRAEKWDACELRAAQLEDLAHRIDAGEHAR